MSYELERETFVDSCFDIVNVCDGQTDRQSSGRMKGRTDRIAVAVIRVSTTVVVLCAKLSKVNVNTTTGVLTAEFRRLRLHKCGFWNNTIARIFHQGRHSLLMTLYTTVNCSTNYISQTDEGTKYFIAIKRSWRFNAYNYNLRRGDKVIRRGRGSSRFFHRFVGGTS